MLDMLTFDDKQQAFIKKYITDLPKPRMMRSKTFKALKADYDRQLRAFMLQIDAVQERLKGVPDQGDAARLQREIDGAWRILGADDKPNFEGARNHLQYIVELIEKAKTATAPVIKVRNDKERRDYVDAHKNEPQIKRMVHRRDEVAKEIPALKAARTKLEADLKALRDKRGTLTQVSEMRALNEEYAEKLAASEALAARIAQFEKFQEDESDRVDMLLDIDDRMDETRTATMDLTSAIGTDPLALVPSLDLAARSVYAFSFESIAAAVKATAALQTRVDFEEKRVVRADVVFPTETEITAISSAQAALLGGQLENARKLLAPLDVKKKKLPKPAVVDRSLKYIALIHQQVQTDLSLYLQCRLVGLPPVPEVEVKPSDRLDHELTRIDVRAIGLYGAAAAKVPGLRKQVETLRGDLVKAKTDKEVSAVELKITALSDEVAKLETDLPESLDSKGRTEAKKVASDVAKKLAEDLFKTEALKPDEIAKIEDPTKVHGPDGPPKDEIPLDEVLKVGEGDKAVYYRIQTKKQKGVSNVHRRDDKKIPREVIDMFKGRVDTLNAMAETLSEDCEDLLIAYADETARMMETYTTPESHKHYEDVRQAIIDLDKKVFKHKTVLAHQPIDLPGVQLEWEDFKKKHLDMKPADAYAAVFGSGKLKEKLEGLVKKAERAKEIYESNKNEIAAVFRDLSAVLDQSGLGDGGAFGSEIARLMNGEAVRLAKKYGTDPALVQQIETAAAVMQKTGGDASDFHGGMRRDLEKAFKYNKMKDEASVRAARDMARNVAKERDKFNSMLGNRANLDAQGRADFVKRLADMMTDQAEGSKQYIKEKADYDGAKKKYKTALSAAKSAKKGKFNKKELETKIDGIEASYKGIKKDTETYFTYTTGKSDLEELTRELTEIEELAKTDKKGGHARASKIKVKPRAEALKTSLETMADVASKVIGARARTKLSDVQEKDKSIGAGLDKADASLALVKSIIDVGELVTLGGKMDAGKHDKKSVKIARREEGLTVLRRARDRLKSHPAVQLYSDNPFDMGAAEKIVLTNFHNVEIGILATVDPRESDD